MPNVQTQTALITPTSGTSTGALVDYQMASYRQNNGTVSLACVRSDGEDLSSATSYLGTITVGIGKTAGTLSSPISGLIRSITQVTPNFTATGTATTQLLDAVGGTIVALAAQDESVITNYGTTQPISTAMKFVTTVTGGTGEVSAVGVQLNVHYER